MRTAGLSLSVAYIRALVSHVEVEKRTYFLSYASVSRLFLSAPPTLREVEIVAATTKLWTRLYKDRTGVANASDSEG